MDEKQRAFFETYCTECHNAEKQKGKLRLDDISFRLDTVENAERWQKILNQINAGEMPPEDAKQPEKGAKTEFLDALSRTLVTARKALADQHGRVTMRRLNRREYQNTLRDLLGVTVNTRDLPADGSAQSFDTVGASLFMSSDQIEQYLTLGRSALENYFAQAKRTSQPAPAGSSAENRPNEAPQKRIERREVETWANRDVRGLLGGYYLGGFKSAKQWTNSDKSKPPKEFGLPDEAEAKFRIHVFETHGPSFVAYLTNPLTETGSLLTIYNVHPREFVALPPEPMTPGEKPREPVPPGDYLLRVRVGQTPKAPKDRAFLEMGIYHKENGFSPRAAFHITGTTAKPQILEIPVKITADGPRTFSFREKVAVGAEHDIYMESQRRTGVGPDPALWIDWVEWEGPLESDGKGAGAALLTKATQGELTAPQVRELLENFAQLAFRDQKPAPDYVDKLLGLFEEKKRSGAPFLDALQEPLSVILASPGFLYLQEPTDDTTPRALSPREIAVRLAYFLWSAPPDARLLELANRGELTRPEVLSGEVERLLADPRSYEFVTGLTRQWLDMDRLDFFQFNAKKFRSFDESTKAAAKEEVTRTFQWLLKNNLSLASLLKSDFVVVNGLLASFYGIEGVSGDAFRKVQLPPDSPRGGLLGMAAILAMGSNGEQTSPVERGAWVLRKLLHDPPPPAPKGVPQLTRLEGKILTTRERLMAHQEEPQCAQCHRKIDPIGFGLENFNTVGLWRTHDLYEKRGVGKKEWEIDPAGTLHNGPAFASYFELRDRIAEKPERFARGFAEALVHYGLGRPVGFSDEDLLEQLVQAAAKKNFAMREFILALVQSKPFQTK
ncbi:MAG: hypothetical protein RLZZ399_2682 [Verrucomicrobiota bacterium]